MKLGMCHFLGPQMTIAGNHHRIQVHYKIPLHCLPFLLSSYVSPNEEIL